MTNLNGHAVARAAPTPAPAATNDDPPGQQVTELPVLDLVGKDYNDYVLYVRKVPSGGTQDFRIPIGAVIGQSTIFRVSNKAQMRTLTPTSAGEECHCLGGVIPFDNQGGIYITVQSSDADNNGDRIRPTDFRGYVWYRWM